MNTNIPVKGVRFDGKLIPVMDVEYDSHKTAAIIEKRVTSILPEDIEGLTTIPDSWQNTNVNLISVKLPDSVTSIGGYAFSGCSKLSEFDFGNGLKRLKAHGLFASAHLLDTTITIPESVESMYCPIAFEGSRVTEVIFLNKDTVKDSCGMYSNVFNRTFWGATKLKKVSGLNLILQTEKNEIFTNDAALTDLYIYNIKYGLQIAWSNSWGHLLTTDSLINTVKELWDHSSESTTQTLTIGNVNLEKISDVYVKLIEPTEEMLAGDEYANNKLPCEVCESTDEGAMLLKDYASLKNWNIV